MKKYLFIMVLVLIAAPLLVAGCTSSTSPSPSPSATTQAVSATATTTGTATATSAAKAATSSASAMSVTVTIPDFSFQPASITIQRGATVTWRNDATVAHHVVSDTNVFSSPVLNPGQTYSHTFTQPGTYPYHCAIHPSMTGTITVQ